MCVRDIGVEEGDDYLNLKIDGDGLSDKYSTIPSRCSGTMLRVAASFKVPRIARLPKLNEAVLISSPPSTTIVCGLGRERPLNVHQTSI
jgi:hypothetical protein